MDTVQVSCALTNVKSFLGGFPSDMLPDSITWPSTVIGNTHAHTELGSQWLSIRLDPWYSTAFYVYAYGLFLYIPDIQSFLRRYCTVVHYINAQL
jgi:hypothetical protein